MMPNPPIEFAPFGGWDAAKARRPSASRWGLGPGGRAGMRGSLLDLLDRDHFTMYPGGHPLRFGLDGLPAHWEPAGGVHRPRVPVGVPDVVRASMECHQRRDRSPRAEVPGRVVRPFADRHTARGVRLDAPAIGQDGDAPPSQPVIVRVRGDECRPVVGGGGRGRGFFFLGVCYCYSCYSCYCCRFPLGLSSRNSRNSSSNLPGVTFPNQGG